MRRQIEFWINGEPHGVSGAEATATLSEYLRETLGLVGTKIVCSEGDCGACSVLLGRVDPTTSELSYQVVDSCIAFLFQLDQTHIVTVEGLGDEQHLSSVQQSMVQCHGSQCGFCTPGFVVAMHGVIESRRQVSLSACSDDAWRVGLSGNLCRCTGYVQILEACHELAAMQTQGMRERFSSERLVERCLKRSGESVLVESAGATLFIPASLEEAIAFLADHPSARIVAGATDIGVQRNHGRVIGQTLMYVGKISTLLEIAVVGNEIVFGAAATWTAVLDAMREPYPEFAAIVEKFGSPQIRNMGSIGGNLANASPIADSIPFLIVIGARVRMISSRGWREVALEDFFLGFKQIDRAHDELIEAIICPLSEENDHVRVYKVSKRRDMDISTFTAGILVSMQEGIITNARVALGGVGPTVIRSRNAELAMIGQPFSEAVMRLAGERARAEVKPITDVRGSEEFRAQLTQNAFLKCFHELKSEC